MGGVQIVIGIAFWWISSVLLRSLQDFFDDGGGPRTMQVRSFFSGGLVHDPEQVLHS